MLWKYLTFIVATGLAVPAVLGLLTGAWTESLLGGGAALAGALVGMGLLRSALTAEPTRIATHTLGAMVGAMLLRMVLLGIGLVIAVRVLSLGGSMYILAFFLVYAVTQILEVLYIHRAGKARQAMAT